MIDVREYFPRYFKKFYDDSIFLNPNGVLFIKLIKLKTHSFKYKNIFHSSVTSIVLSLTLFSAAIAPRSAHALAAGIAGTASIVPGLGQTLEGNFLEGLSWFSSVILLMSSSNGLVRQIGFDLWLYNSYDAYRDAKPSDGRFAQHNVVQNYIAAFNPLNASDRVGLPIIGFGAYAGASKGYPNLKNPAQMAMFGFVGMGEEGLFRGFLFPAFTWLSFDSKVMGAITSSAAFAAFHAVGGKENLAFSPMIQRFVMGLIFSYQADRNRYDLRNGIFAHAWYDILVDGGAHISAPGGQATSASPLLARPSGIQMTIPF